MHFIIKIVIVLLLNWQYTRTNTTYTSVADQNDKLQTSIANGSIIYKDFCLQCHKTNGSGSKNYPPLAKSDWLINSIPQSIHAVKYGLKGKITVNGKIYKRTMPKSGLEDAEIADVMNYIMNSWGNTQKTMITPKEVSAIKK
ncbi:c-type cytochrome [Aquimarina agarivorans]|uniref:c-type cytochrome n=1 Tax=Aquimarina agarivorans TaxID=980584 RepID=UPI000248E6B3|nr:c-type cytochrome [Aquimarina agarivorans]